MGAQEQWFRVLHIGFVAELAQMPLPSRARCWLAWRVPCRAMHQASKKCLSITFMSSMTLPHHCAQLAYAYYVSPLAQFSFPEQCVNIYVLAYALPKK